jgi:type III pantothenate kinase
MKNLLIDIGNSSIKTALSSGRRISSVKRTVYEKNNFPQAAEKILTYVKSDFDSIGISCLNKKYQSEILKIVRKKYGLNPFFINYNSPLPIKFDYEKTLGNDRICSAVAAAAKYNEKKNILVIDFGTATTYNLILNKVFWGGLITPGILTSLEALNSRANLPLTGIKDIKEMFSKKTKLNILSGVIHQSLFATEGIISAIKKKYRNIFVISTGGLAELIYKKTRLINKNEQNLVLEGINIILNYNS